MPVGAMIAKAELMSWGPGAHGSTYGGNPVALAALLETIRLLEGGLIANAGDPRPRGHGRPAAARWTRYPALVKDVRGKGLMIGDPVRLRRDRRRRPDAGVRPRAARPRGRRRLRADVAAARRVPGRGGDRRPDLHGVRRPRRRPSGGGRARSVKRRARAGRSAGARRDRPPADSAEPDRQERWPCPARSPRCATRSRTSCGTATRSRSRGSRTSSASPPGHEIIRQRKRDLDARPDDAGPRSTTR